jgi:hypothetical protein
MKLFRILGAPLFAIPLHGLAQAVDATRLPVADVRVLMVAAIDSPSGSAQGLLTGKDAESITRHFKASSPILIDVTTLKRYAQAGCSRLNVSFSQEGVQLPGQQGPKRHSVDFGINFCRDGQPPRSLS